LDADFLTAVEAGELTRNQIEQWARAIYAATRSGRTILGTFCANSPDDPELRRELADNLYEEETGRLSGVNKCHMDVFVNLLAAFGIDEPEAASLRSPLGDYVAQGRAIAADDFYVELTAYGLSIEAPNADFCQRIFDALRTHYDFTPQQLTWFSMLVTLVGAAFKCASRGWQDHLHARPGRRGAPPPGTGSGAGPDG
jgi:pyrroloquinoline quinone (PQQ) biosynthesis protein C